MATLSLTVGPLTSSKEVDNTKAQNVLASIIALRNPELVEGTNQQKLDWVVQQLIPQMLTQLSRQYHEQ